MATAAHYEEALTTLQESTQAFIDFWEELLQGDELDVVLQDVCRRAIQRDQHVIYAIETVRDIAARKAVDEERRAVASPLTPRAGDL